MHKLFDIVLYVKHIYNHYGLLMKPITNTVSYLNKPLGPTQPQ